MTRASILQSFPQASEAFILANLGESEGKEPSGCVSVQRGALSGKLFIATPTNDVIRGFGNTMALDDDFTCSTIKFTVPIAPIGAPRMTRRDRWAKRPCVVKYHQWRDAVRPHIPELPKNPVGLSWTVYFPFPPSYSPKKQKELSGKPHREKPDRDNVDKALMDLMFEQDKGVAIGTLQKLWDDGLGPRIEIEVVP